MLLRRIKFCSTKFSVAFFCMTIHTFVCERKRREKNYLIFLQLHSPSPNWTIESNFQGLGS